MACICSCDPIDLYDSDGFRDWKDHSCVLSIDVLEEDGSDQSAYLFGVVNGTDFGESG